MLLFILSLLLQLLLSSLVGGSHIVNLTGDVIWVLEGTRYLTEHFFVRNEAAASLSALESGRCATFELISILGQDGSILGRDYLLVGMIVFATLFRHEVDHALTVVLKDDVGGPSFLLLSVGNLS